MWWRRAPAHQTLEATGPTGCAPHPDCILCSMERMPPLTPTRRILLLNTLLEAGGAQKAMLQLARGLRDRGHEITVATMYDKAGCREAFEQRFGVPIVDLEMKPAPSDRADRPGKLGKLWHAGRGVRRLRRLLRRQRIEVLQTFSHYSNVLGPMVARGTGVRVCVTSQRMRLEGRSPWLLRADRWISRSRLAQRMVAVSESVRTYCIEDEGIAPDHVVTIANGLDIENWPSNGQAADRTSLRQTLGIEPDAPMVTTVARLHPQKGYEHLLEAVPGVLEAHPSAHFVWVGDGELEDALSQRIHSAKLEGRVHLTGARSDVPDLLAASDLFVLPSLWEGMPNAVLEAMAAGLPVVATAVDGTPEIVAEGETGWLVPPADGASLREAIRQALGDPARREAMGRAGRQRVERHFSLTRYVDQFEQLYAQLLGGGDARHRPDADTGSAAGSGSGAGA